MVLDINQIHPVHRQDVTTGIVDNILKMIADGYWEPGEQLPSQRKLSSLMNVSMASLREALYSLQAMGVLEMRHGVGTFVSSHTMDPGEKLIELSLILGGMDIRMFFEAREVIEPGLACLAAEHATDMQLVELFRILDEQSAAFDIGDDERLHDLDLAFHQQIADMANNKFLFQINDVLFKNLDKLFRVLPLTKGGWLLHRKVAEAIRIRNCEDAYSEMRALIHKSFTNYLPYLESGQLLDRR